MEKLLWHSSNRTIENIIVAFVYQRITEVCSVHFVAFVLLAFAGRNVTPLNLYAQINMHMRKVTLWTNCVSLRIDILNSKPEINWLHVYARGAFLGACHTNSESYSCL